PGGANKLDKIVKYMQTHFEEFVNPKPDWAAFRGLMFHQFLGFSPAQAAVNLSQTPLMTFPFLASKFGRAFGGDARAAGALLRANSDWNNFYKKASIKELVKNAPPGPEGAQVRALGEAMKRGVLTESLAHELAAISEDRNLLRPFGKKAEQFWLKYQDA